MKRIVIFASGSGTNAENIIKYFNGNPSANVVKVFSNKKDAMVLARAKRLKVPVASFNREAFTHPEPMLAELKDSTDFIILAGFLWKIPAAIIAAFPNKIINIHPALLPSYGGKGMYGMHVHNAVVKNKETSSGITIHFVNENYDEGAVIFQKKVAVLPGDSAEMVASKIHELEYEYFPKMIEKTMASDE